jgi:hypothetical protein
LLILGLAFALAALAIAALVVGQRGDDHTTTVTTEAPAPTAPIDVAVAPPRYIVYLTGTAEQAATLPELLAAFAPVTDARPTGEVMALPAGTADEQARALHMIAMLDDATNGSRVQVVDLRGSSDGVSRGRGGGCEQGLGAGASNIGAC